ncbi:2Fe-2S iron-sulfur cluster-binding protein [Gilvimarinus xylanilyticus]|uniref:2Fe-2S iron-sulfur cluster binding domain-containing protein n=1 Tax=Gilvimarinus xylanilyticus TaxID=2944139 RepID=A0A9X2I235_9GAMM|nr:2Fe-2S iron-sulfur cluster binding domain-containing protein [Gilvimarinus xylanilyticus]MCP8899333.1 2Fe-2S iron-sulfur cluster binding domain-containing protein [Gilvimarinus xylanilyticus]
MTKVFIDDKAIDWPTQQPLLDVLRQQGYPVAFSCRSGVCQSCQVRITQGTPPAAAQAGLTVAQKEKQLVLSCCCYSEQDLGVSLYDPREEQVTAEVLSVTSLADDIIELRLRAPVAFHGGQYMTLWRDAQTPRNYSIASAADDDHLSFHIQVRPDGQFSRWAKQLSPTDHLSIYGPLGDCHYQPEHSERPLLLAACGTGIAPLYAVAREALAKGHSHNIHILYAARSAARLYWRKPLEQLAQNHAQVRLDCLILEDPSEGKRKPANVYEFVRSELTGLQNHQIFLCGAPSFVQKMRKQCFMAGARPRQVCFDAFEAGR